MSFGGNIMVKEKRRYFKSMLSSLEIMKKDEDNKPARLRLRTTTQPFKRTKSFSIGAPRHYVAGGNTLTMPFVLKYKMKL